MACTIVSGMGLQVVSQMQQPGPPPRPPLLQTMREAPVTTLLFAICVVVFLAASLTGGTTNSANLIRFGAVGRAWVWAGEFWRLATAMFLHIGPVHLGANLLFGFRLCTLAE